MSHFWDDCPKGYKSTKNLQMLLILLKFYKKNCKSIKKSNLDVLADSKFRNYQLLRLCDTRNSGDDEQCLESFAP